MLWSYVVGAAAALVSTVHAVAAPQPAWTNHNLVKNIDLAGSSSLTTTTISIRPVGETQQTTPYYFYLNTKEADKIAWSRITVKLGAEAPLSKVANYKSSLRPVLHLEDHGALDNDESTTVYSVNVPSDMLGTDGTTLTLETMLNHLTTALPETVAQTEPQLLLWQGDAAVRSPYNTLSARIKIKTPSANILSLSPASSGSKSGSSVQFGPYTSVSPHTGGDVEQGSVHYQSDAPQITVVSLERVAEVSHWGDALSIEDRILLRNTGPTLKGHFSRIQHQMAAFYRQSGAQPSVSNALSTLAMFLPAGARDPYFLDQIGNVSTSRFRSTPPNPALLDQFVMPTTPANVAKLSLLELQPRFPLMGGWNYTFSVGFNVPLSTGGWLKQVSSSSREYVVAVPLFTPMRDVAMDSIRTTIVLPELSTNIKLELPFPVDSSTHSITHTYLDTAGRPTVTLTKRNCANHHGRLVYIKYTLPATAHFRKVFSVAAVTLTLFAAAALAQRLDTKIN